MAKNCLWNHTYNKHHGYALNIINRLLISQCNYVFLVNFYTNFQFFPGKTNKEQGFQRPHFSCLHVIIIFYIQSRLGKLRLIISSHHNSLLSYKQCLLLSKFNFHLEHLWLVLQITVCSLKSQNTKFKWSQYFKCQNQKHHLYISDYHFHP